MTIQLLPSAPAPHLLAKYAALFEECFPKANTLDATYLRWLYESNPAGTVVGFDAWSDDRLAAHYVCVPARANVNGRIENVLLSLNTATSPQFQGRGLFTKLAQATYDVAAEKGFAAVYGIANANSTPGFVRKLGFDLVRALDARVGLGTIGAGSVPAQPAESFHRVWDQAALAWRISNPARPYRLVRTRGGVVGAQASTGRPGLCAWAELPPAAAGSMVLNRASPAMRLHLGLRPGRVKRSGFWFDIPVRFRPSPLNLIFKPLVAGVERLDGDEINLGQLDFDAF